MNTHKKQTDRAYIRALVIRLRLYLALEYGLCKTEEDRFAFASDVLNISPSRAMHILIEYKDVKKLTKKECIKKLQKISFPMYIVATCDITYDKYFEFLRRNNRYYD